MAASNVPKGCVESAWFYTKLEELKESKKAKTSKTTLFIEDCFFDETKTWLQTNPEERKSLNLGKLTKQKITRNNRVLSNGGKIITSDNKCVVPKRELMVYCVPKYPLFCPQDYPTTPLAWPEWFTNFNLFIFSGR